MVYLYYIPEDSRGSIFPKSCLGFIYMSRSKLAWYASILSTQHTQIQPGCLFLCLHVLLAQSGLSLWPVSSSQKVSNPILSIASHFRPLQSIKCWCSRLALTPYHSPILLFLGEASRKKLWFFLSQRMAGSFWRNGEWRTKWGKERSRILLPPAFRVTELHIK